MSAGFSASGSKKCDVATVAMGRMATKSVIFQSYGTNGATARMIMPTMNMSDKSIEYLNCERRVSCQPIAFLYLV